MKHLIKSFFSLSLIALALISTHANAKTDPNNKGNWTGHFDLTDGNWVDHYPDHMVYDDSLWVDSGLYLNGLCLQTNMSRAEFVAELKRNKLYKGR